MKIPEFPKQIVWLIDHPIIGLIISISIVLILAYYSEIINLITKGKFEKEYEIRGGKRK